jgi:ATP-dependent RNA helicase SUPV3L1/SUV3
MVEGHAIGRLDGFVFTPDASAAGSEAKTLAGAAQKALAGEIDARAAKLALAADEQFVLALDGVVRWLGQPVAKLIAGEEVLKPRLRIVADERLTGASRDAVQARLDLWLKTHIEKVLGPLFQLAAAEDVTGIARGVAFQLCEALGVLERAKINEELKSLEQPMRATLRKYGVRFGAYHIFIPALLKPGPRVLALQLFALKHEGADIAGFDAVERLAVSGRTSIAADKEVAGVLYRTAGYRVCGERAVRVDILERLADIIRPALAWRAGAPGLQPAAAFTGGGFTVTTAMTSLTGCSGEEFASILRSIGYRMEHRPKPAAPPPAAPEAATAEPTQTDAPSAAAEKQPDEVASAPLDAQAPPETMDQPVESASVEAEPPTEPILDTVTDAQSEPPQTIEAPAIVPEPVPSGATEHPQDGEPEQVTQAAEAAVAETPAAPPDMVEVWRPARPEGQRRPRHRPQRSGEQPGPRDNRRTRAPSRAVAVPTAPAEGSPAAEGVAAIAPEGAPGGDERKNFRGRRRRPDGAVGGDRPPHPGRPAHSNRPPRSDRPDRPDRPAFSGRPGKRDRGEQPDPALRAQYMNRGHESRRDKAPDPDSPFAKLAALKAQLEADAKERR